MATKKGKTTSSTKRGTPSTGVVTARAKRSTPRGKNAVHSRLTPGTRPSELETLKKLVLLQKVKQTLLSGKKTGRAREHPLVGEDILQHIEQMKKVRKIMRAHHGKWDGNGYPDGLKLRDHQSFNFSTFDYLYLVLGSYLRFVF